MSADLYFTTDSFFLSLYLFLFCRLISELAEGNSTKMGHILGSIMRFENACLKFGVSPPRTNRGPKTTCLGRLCNLTANLTAYIFGMKHDIDDRSNALTTTRGLLHRHTMSWTLVHKRLKTRPAFYPPSVNSAFCFIARLRRRRSANITQPNFCQTADGKSR